MYQQSLMANALAQFMVSQGYDANDTAAVSTFNSNLVQALSLLADGRATTVVNNFKAEARQVNINVTDTTTDGTVLFTVPREPTFILSTHTSNINESFWLLGMGYPYTSAFYTNNGTNYIQYEKEGLNFVYNGAVSKRLPFNDTVSMVIFY
nr:MAG TPA: hypothetical protein [Caudoviricetes sp.]